MAQNDVIRRPEYEGDAEEIGRRLKAIEDWQRERDRQDREDRRWKWTQVLAALTVAATLADLGLALVNAR